MLCNMFFLIIQQILISLAIIVLVHYLIKTLQNKFSTPKVIDLVENTDKEYNKICKIINLADNDHTAAVNNICNSSNNTTLCEEVQNKNICSNSAAPANSVPANSVPANSAAAPTFEDTDLSNDTTSLSGLDEKNNLYSQMNGELQSYFDNM